MNKHKTSLFIFRRDLRLYDNTALNNAIEQSDHVIPCFVFDPRQIDPKKNDYYSTNAVQCMIESLQDLTAQLKKYNGTLYLFYGTTEDVLKKLFATLTIDALFINNDYTPFSKKRDHTIQQLCIEHTIVFSNYDDALLNSPEAIKKKDGSFYSVFTPFYHASSKYPVRSPCTTKLTNFYTGHISLAKNENLYNILLPVLNKNIAVKGGRRHALKLCNQLNKLKNYTHDHDYPSIKTSHFSAHLKFGTLSVRELFYSIIKKLGRSHLLIRQLYWRDFFTHIAYHKPEIFGHPFRKKYENIAWSDNKKLFIAWCQGKTGFPIVDAGMRELNTTGFMHNRVRMIVASFLTKDLHINWLWGEKYFAQKLVDYDPAINNGNWQWIASTGCDAQPYFRIFNPWLQQKKFDPECTYIKKWAPELNKYDPKIIHNWFKPNSAEIKNYPRPIIDHAQESALAKKIYKQRT